MGANHWTIMKSPIPDEFKWQNWAADDEGLTGDQLMDFINNSLFPTLRI